MRRMVLGCVLVAALAAPMTAQAFCGFFVAGAGAELYNSRSEVVMVRDGERTTLTLQFNYKGDPDQFALVLPVPVVLQKEDVKVSRRELFKRLDTYTAPRLVDYPAENPCQKLRAMEGADFVTGAVSPPEEPEEEAVKVEAAFSVEEYDIVVLSAKESNALETWLKESEYVIPEGGAPYYTPYIEKGMFFFVVKVNLAKLQDVGEAVMEDGYQMLRPLQFTFESEGWMLPIQLGKINAADDQHLILYALHPEGRVKAANYNNADIPTNLHLDPKYKQDPEGFAQLYKAALDKTWKQQQQETLLTEYYWNASSCDPCPTDPPSRAELTELGFPEGTSAYITRLHAKYAKDTWMQDLNFELAGQGSFFQGRYIMHHPYTGDDIDCLSDGLLLHHVKRGEISPRTDAHRAALADARQDPSLYLDAFLGAPDSKGSATGSKAGGDSAYLALGYTASCTELGCPEDNPCCNACNFQRWELVQHPDKTVDFSGVKSPPTCKLNGCGVCDVDVEVSGRFDGDRFVVANWRRAEPIKAASVEKAPEAGAAQEAKEEGEESAGGGGGAKTSTEPEGCSVSPLRSRDGDSTPWWALGLVGLAWLRRRSR